MRCRRYDGPDKRAGGRDVAGFGIDAEFVQACNDVGVLLNRISVAVNALLYREGVPLLGTRMANQSIIGSYAG